MNRIWPDLAQMVARLARRMPILARLAQVLVSWLQTRFTAGVVGVIANDRGEILVVEHVFHPQNPWGLPGGWLGRNEGPIAALERELKEELGLAVDNMMPLIIESGYFTRSHLDIAYFCRAIGDVQGLSNELLNYRWNHPSSLPKMPPFHNAAVQAAIARNLIE